MGPGLDQLLGHCRTEDALQGFDPALREHQVQAVAAKYLVDRQLTTAELVPLPMETGSKPQTDVPGYTRVDFALRAYQGDGPWEVSLICSNCGNEKYVVSVQDKPLQKIGDLTGQIADPRFVTIQGTYRW